jgi:hypothetical protein
MQLCKCEIIFNSNIIQYTTNTHEGPSWSWSYGSWIYNCAISPISTKVVSSCPVHGEVYSMQPYVIKFVSDLRQVGGFLLVVRFPLPLNWPPRYTWNIVESGVKHHNPNPYPIFYNDVLQTLWIQTRGKKNIYLWPITS